MAKVRIVYDKTTDVLSLCLSIATRVYCDKMAEIRIVYCDKTTDMLSVVCLSIAT